MSIYNEPTEWISEAIDSILNQTFQDFEFIIVNDNPDRIENSLLLKKYSEQDDRIKIISNKINIGLTKSLNIAISYTQGDFIARMDADDISNKFRFEKQISFLVANPHIGVCGSFIKTFGDYDHLIKYPLIHDNCFLFFESPFAHPAIMLRKSLLVQNNILYDERIRYSQDFDLWERLYSKTKFANLPEVLLNYRINSQQITKKRHSEQYAISTAIKFRAFNTYCSCNNINYQLNYPINLQTIKDFKINVPKNVKFNRNLFTSYLYRSIKKDRLPALFYLFLSGDVFRLGGMTNGIKTIVTLAFLRKKQAFLTK